MKGQFALLLALALLFALAAPAPALASRASYVRSHGFTHRDRTPRVHDNTPRPRRHRKNH